MPESAEVDGLDVLVSLRITMDNSYSRGTGCWAFSKFSAKSCRSNLLLFISQVSM